MSGAPKAGVRRPCDAGCGAEYIPRSKVNRFCSDRCRQQSHRGAGIGPSSAEDAKPEAPPAVSVADSVLVELVGMGMEDSVIGKQALAMAARMDSSRDMASSVAAASRELSRLMAEAAASASRMARDPFDEVAERRERRRTA